MNDPRLPTPLHLSEALTRTISKVCQCEGSWAQHPQAMSLEEFLQVQKSIAFYFQSYRGGLRQWKNSRRPSANR
jgi:hypothetical protein